MRPLIWHTETRTTQHTPTADTCDKHTLYPYIHISRNALCCSMSLQTHTNVSLAYIVYIVYYTDTCHIKCYLNKKCRYQVFCQASEKSSISDFCRALFGSCLEMMSPSLGFLLFSLSLTLPSLSLPSTSISESDNSAFLSLQTSNSNDCLCNLIYTFTQSPKSRQHACVIESLGDIQ